MRPAVASLLALLVVPLGACQAAGTRVTNVIGIDTVEGVNDVQRFAPDGRQAVIIEARQSGPNTPPVFLVMLPRSTPRPGWDVVGVSDGNGRVETGPNGGGTLARGVRFARAKVGGMPATLMFIATASGDPGRFRIVTYRLSTDGEDGSGLSAVFDPIRTTDPERTFCSPVASIDAMEDLDPAPGDSCPRA